MTRDEAAIIIGNIPLYPDECYTHWEYMQAKAMAVQALMEGAPKHGKWLPYEFGDWKWHKCSVCGVADEYGREIRREFTGFKEERLFARHNFCPHCGAKMENPREEVKK